MDIRIFKYFIAIVEAGNISKAAEQLHITQPTLSRQLKELEEEVGSKLFIRGKREMILTDAGFLYFQRIKEILSLIEKAEQDLIVHQNDIAGVVAIGCVETSAAIYLADHIEDFSKLYPLVQYDIYNGFSDDIKIKLDSGNIDLGILIEPVEAAKYEYIRLPIEERWGLLMKISDPLATREDISIEEVRKLPLIVTNRHIVKDDMENWLGVDESQLNIFARQNLLTNTSLLVERNLAYMITVEGAYRIRPIQGLVFVPIVPKRTSSHVLAWRKNKVFNPAIQLFLKKIVNLEKMNET